MPGGPVSDSEPTELMMSRAVWACQTRRALMTLSQGQRAVLELSYFTKLTHREIASRLSLPLPMVHLTAAGGLAALGRAIEASLA